MAICRRNDTGRRHGRPGAYRASDANALTPLGVGRPSCFSWVLREIERTGSSNAPKGELAL